MRFKLGPEWGDTRGGDRLVLGSPCFSVQGCVMWGHLKGKFKECANKTYFFYLKKRTALDVVESKWIETQTTFGTLKFYYAQTEFLYLIVRSIYIEEADLHWKLRLIFKICFFYYILSYMIYTKYIIVCVIIYSLVCVLNFILFAGRLYIFFDVNYYIKVLTNETGKFMSVRFEDANLRL